MPATEPSNGASGWNTWGHAVTTIVNSVEDAPARLTALEAGTSSLADGAVTNAKVNTSAAINADKLADGTTNKVLTATERTKLAGVATGATANSSDATLLARANHTGTQTASTVSDFSEAVDDRVAALLIAGTNVILTYNDGANTLTVAAAGTSVPVHAVGNSGPTLTVDASVGPIKTITLTANCTFTLSGATAGQATVFELVLTQDGAGTRTVTWPASVKWSGGAPLLSVAAGAIDRIAVISYDGGTTWYGTLIGKAYA